MLASPTPGQVAAGFEGRSTLLHVYKLGMRTFGPVAIPLVPLGRSAIPLARWRWSWKTSPSWATFVRLAPVLVPAPKSKEHVVVVVVVVVSGFNRMTQGQDKVFLQASSDVANEFYEHLYSVLAISAAAPTVAVVDEPIDTATAASDTDASAVAADAFSPSFDIVSMENRKLQECTKAHVLSVEGELESQEEKVQLFHGVEVKLLATRLNETIGENSIE